MGISNIAYVSESGRFIYAKNGNIGKNLQLHSNIGTPGNPVKYVEIGDNVYIGSGCNIQIPELRIGDYTKIHRNGLIFGRNPVKIGHNCWFGENTIIDCEGHTTIGNGVGAGAYSQLWSHIRHGDTLEGCRYLQFGNLIVDDDVWFVGSCIVSPIHAAAKSVALVGSVVTKDMEANHVYGGAPAKDLTDKLGPPFKDRTVDEKFEDLKIRYENFCRNYKEAETKIKIVKEFSYPASSFITEFNVTTRTYTKTGSDIEIKFMQHLLPEAKFVSRM